MSRRSGNSNGSNGNFQRGNGTSVTDLDIGALPLVNNAPLPIPENPPSNNSAILNFRAGLPMLDARFLNRIGGALAPDVHESIKFYATAFGLSDDLAGNGRRRANVNALVTSSANSNAAVPADAIAGNIDDIVYVITGTHLIPPLSPAPAPDNRVFKNAPNNFANTLTTFGSRFWAVSPAPTADQRNMYVERVAANIRDYIDTDSQPTIIDASGPTVRASGVPAHPIETGGGGTSGPSEVVAIGKERVPFAQEYVLRVREVAFAPRTGASANYTITIDHYVEFWNMSKQDIPLTDLGPNPFLLIANQPGWDAGGLDDIAAGAPRDLKLPLSSATNSATHAPLLSFPAGSVTVITTDPTPLSTNGSSTPVLTGPLTPDLTRVFYIPITPDNGVTGLRTYSGRTQKKSGSELRLNLIARTTSSTDYETEIALGNDLGILESDWGAGCIASALSVNIDNVTPAENRLDDTKYHFRGGALKGNSAVSFATTGDPRTNAEQIRFDLNGASANNDKTRYFDNGLDSSHVPGNSTLGTPNSNYVIPANWPDFSSSAQAAASAPTVIANGSLTSIGQLGDILIPSERPVTPQVRIPTVFHLRSN